MGINNKLTESKFKACKILLNSGATVKEVMAYMELSEPVIYGIRAVDTFAEYKAERVRKDLERKQVAAIKAKEAKAKEAAAQVGAVPAATLSKCDEKPGEVVKEIRQTVTVQATHYMMQELQRTNELLALISNKLAFIVDELCGVPNQK